MPRSIISAASSGGHFSRVTFTASTMLFTVSARASATSREVTAMVFGRPLTRSRPRISMDSARSPGIAEPISSFICSEVRSPMARL
ncbi:hypothetical protein D3C75_1283710 [compost metagenome]